MTLLVLIWFVQDLLQVFGLGFLLVPHLFYLTLLYIAICRRQEGYGAGLFIWVAFLGGLLWDFRWTSLPGFSATSFAVGIAFSSAIWERVPSTGRSALLLAFLAMGTHLAMGFVSLLAWGESSNMTVFRLLAIQQLLAVPVVLFFYLLYRWRAPFHHA